VADKHRGGNEVLAIEWATPLSVKPPLFGIAVSRNKHTHDVIRAAGAFTVNVPSTDILKEMWWAGSHTGRQHKDKIAASGLTSKPGSTDQNAVSILEAMASFECKVVDEIPLGDHTLFVGEVKSVEACEDLFDTARGMWYPDKLKNLYRVAYDVFVGSSNSVLKLE
jgi:flavin reductase (DIM6/NTAB) family NADH-FMN oxidoreductase RutF